MHDHTQQALQELRAWQQRMQAKPGLFSKLMRRMQHKANSLIPERIHLGPAVELLHRCDVTLKAQDATHRARCT